MGTDDEGLACRRLRRIRASPEPAETVPSESPLAACSGGGALVCGDKSAAAAPRMESDGWVVHTTARPTPVLAEGTCLQRGYAGV